MQKTIRLSWIFVALTLVAISTTPAGAITQYVIQNASSAYTFNLTQTCFYLNEITVGGSPVYNAILNDSGDAPIWKVVFMKRDESPQIGTLSNIEFTSSEFSPSSVSQTGDVITITWQNCGNLTYHFNVTAVVAMQTNGVYATIEVQNSTPDEGDDIKYRLMEVHFPYVVLGPSSFETPPESGDDRLSMNTYVLESPADHILPELPYPTPTPGATPPKNGWSNDFGKGNARYPFNLYYKDGCLNSSETACGFYFAVYNSFGYPCQVNFAKNVDPSFSADSFFYDVVLYPHGYDIIDTTQNDFTMPPGMYIECYTPMKGNWYDAAQRYRAQTDILASYFATPTPGLPVPETTATPIWHTTPIHANSNIPNYVKNASIIYYVSPQVSDYDFCVNGQYPVAEQARRLKDFLFTDQSPAVYNRIQAISQFPVITWPFLFQGADTHPYFAPEWAGGNYPVTNQTRYEDHCRAHTSELVALLQQTGTPTPGMPSPLNLKFMNCGGGFVYHWNDEENWQVHPLFGIFPTPTPTGYVPMLSYGCESNAEWGNDIIGTIQDSLPRKYVNVVPLCFGSQAVFNILWKATSPRGFINSYMDARDGTNSFIGADIDYAGWNIRMCLGDYTTGEDHGHPRNGGNFCLSAWQKQYREFHQQYGSSKAILLEDPSHAYLGSCDLFHTSFFPAIDPGKVEEPVGIGMAKNLKYLMVDTSSDYIKHVPIPQVIAHDRIPMFDGMSGYITGTQFHPEYGPTLYTGYRFNFYHQPTPTPGVPPSDPFKPVRSLNADLAYSYINGNRILVMDVDQPVDAAGTPLPTFTPTPTGTIPIAPIVTPTPPACAYGFMDEQSIATSRTLLKTLVTSYVYYANQQMYDELYKPLFSGRMLRAPELQTLITPVSLAYDNGTGKPNDPWYESLFTYELTSSPVLTSAWHSPSNLPEYVVLSFINFDGATKSIQTKTFDLTTYFASAPGNYTYKRVAYHDPSTLGSIVTITNPQQFSLSVQLPARSVKHYKIFRQLQSFKNTEEQWIDGDYINWNGDDFSDRIQWTDETLRLSLGLADGQLGEEITLAQNVLDVCAVDVTGDALTDLLCLTEDALEIFSYSEDKALLRHVFSSKSNGNPLRISLQEIQPSHAVFRIVSEHSIVDYSIETGSLDIAETVQIEIPSHRIETSLDGYLNADEWVDTVASTDDGTILLIGEDEAGMRIFDAIPLDEDVRVSSIDDIDLDSDADIVLEYTGKKLTGQPLYLKNQGEWKFQ